MANGPGDDAGIAAVCEVSRTHLSVVWPDATMPAAGTWLSGVLELAGTDVPRRRVSASSAPRPINRFTLTIVSRGNADAIRCASRPTITVPRGS